MIPLDELDWFLMYILLFSLPDFGLQIIIFIMIVNFKFIQTK